MEDRYVIGVDIGTTTIEVVLLCQNTLSIIKSANAPNKFVSCELSSVEYTQNPDLIVEIVRGFIEDFMKQGEHNYLLNVEYIGISTQMHGILYVDSAGAAVTPLYTWKDRRGDQIFLQNKTYAEYVNDLTGDMSYCKKPCVSTGYGAVTHYYMLYNKLIPKKAKRFCSIGDYVAMALTGTTEPCSEPSVMASYGCYEQKEKVFGRDNGQFYPRLAHSGETVGVYKYGIDLKKNIIVKTACGDNQASVLAAAFRDIRKTIVVNVGTGSQVSMFLDNELVEKAKDIVSADTEIRPFFDIGSIIVVASLNGGKTYERLVQFFAESCRLLTGVVLEDPYKAIGKILPESPLETDLIVNPSIFGSRANPQGVGAISNLTYRNFNPIEFTAGFLRGMAKELYNMYKTAAFIIYELDKESNVDQKHSHMNAYSESSDNEKQYSHQDKSCKRLVMTGNGLRKNKFLSNEVKSTFAMETKFSEYKEEAAVGAALSTFLFSTSNYIQRK